MDWQPIETAPASVLDGGPRVCVDLWAINPWMDSVSPQTKPHETRFENCFWLTEGTRCPRWVTLSGDTVEDDGFVVTHWMDRPKPPAVSVEGAAG